MGTFTIDTLDTAKFLDAFTGKTKIELNIKASDLDWLYKKSEAKMKEALKGAKNYMKKSTEVKFYTTPTTYMGPIKCCDVDRIIFNPPATIVFWKDGSKTVVKCHGDQTFNPYYGFCAALAKHIYKSNSAVNRMVDKYVSEMTKGTSKKVDAGDTDGDGYVGVYTNGNSRFVNSLVYDHNLGRYCNNCKYKDKKGLEYPCNMCIHASSSEISYWTSEIKKEDK